MNRRTFLKATLATAASLLVGRDQPEVSSSYIDKVLEYDPAFATWWNPDGSRSILHASRSGRAWYWIKTGGKRWTLKN